MVKRKDLRFGKKKKKNPIWKLFPGKEERTKPRKKAYVKNYWLSEQKCTHNYGKSTMRYDQISQGFLTGKSEDHFLKINLQKER